MDSDEVPDLDAREMKVELTTTNRLIQPWVLLKFKAISGQDVTLCDFATAGAYGNYYRTWLPVKNIQPVAFDPSRPVWNNRPQ
jgi:hypothetical protein